MKKYLYITITATLLFSCNKPKVENASEATEEPNQEATSAAIQFKPVFTQTKPLQEIQVSDLEKIVGNHENDTLYVTNFFATWCGPCMKEIPHFKEKMEELKGQPVKFTFVSLDEKEDWKSAVVSFGESNKLSNHIVLVDGKTLTPDFFMNSFSTWKGESIPFTLFKKKDKTEEFGGMMSQTLLNEKINAFK